MFVSCFNFFYSCFVYLHFFKKIMQLFIYLFCFYFLFQKDSSFSNMFCNENNFKKLLYFCLIRYRFEVWKKKTNLFFFFSSMVFFLFLLLSIFILFFFHLFINFLLRLFYCISIFCFMFKYIYFICFHFLFIFKCFKKVSNC